VSNNNPQVRRSRVNRPTRKNAAISLMINEDSVTKLRGRTGYFGAKHCSSSSSK